MKLKMVKLFFLLVLSTGFILLPENSQALIYAPTDSDYVMINAERTVVREGPLSETSFTIGSFDKLVILTEHRPVVTSPGAGLFTVNDVSDAIWQKNGDLAYSSAPDCVGGCSVTFKFDPRGTIPLLDETAGRDFYLTDMLFAENDPKRKIVSFMSDPEPVRPPVRPPENKGKSGGSSVSYNAASETLSFSGHHMVDTGFTGDPVLGADVLIPDFQVIAGDPSGIAMFAAHPNPFFEIAQGSDVFMKAQLDLDYNSNTNIFLGQFKDPVFTDHGSPWIAEMAALFDPSSSNFDPNRKLYFSYDPSDNLQVLTDSFTKNGTSGGPDGIFASSNVPEPGTIFLLGMGLLGGGIVNKKKVKAA